MSVCFVVIVSFHQVDLVEDKERLADFPTKMDENVIHVAAVLKEYRRAGCRSVEELIGIPKIIFQQIIKDDLQEEVTPSCSAFC